MLAVCFAITYISCAFESTNTSLLYLHRISNICCQWVRRMQFALQLLLSVVHLTQLIISLLYLHSGGPDDTENYNLLMQAIRDELDILGQANNRFYGLTAAMPCGPDLINGIDLGKMKDILTEFNLMTYDLHGSWSPFTGPNAPLFYFPGSPELSVHGCTENFLKGGVRKDQM